MSPLESDLLFGDSYIPIVAEETDFMNPSNELHLSPLPRHSLDSDDIDSEISSIL